MEETIPLPQQSSKTLEEETAEFLELLLRIGFELEETRRRIGKKGRLIQSPLFSLSQEGLRRRAHPSPPLAHAASAISDTRSHVVAAKLGRASIRASHATRFSCGAPSTDHSGVWVKKASCGATWRSASDMVSPVK